VAKKAVFLSLPAASAYECPAGIQAMHSTNAGCASVVDLYFLFIRDNSWQKKVRHVKITAI